MNEAVMMLREGEMGRIIMMMKLIVVPIYLGRADVVAQPWPLCYPLHFLMIPLNTYAHSHVCACSSRSLTQTLFMPQSLACCHCTTFVKAISSRHQRNADNGTHSSTSCPSTGILFPRWAAPRSHDCTAFHQTAVLSPGPFFKTHNPFCLPVSMFLYTSTRCRFATSANSNTHTCKHCRLDWKVKRGY